MQGDSIAVVDRWKSGLGLQLASASCRRSSNVGPAGRRRGALFDVGWPALLHDNVVLIMGGLLKVSPGRLVSPRTGRLFSPLFP